MATINENFENFESEEVGNNGQVIVCGLSCGGLCLLLGGFAAAFSTMTSALY